MRFQVILFGRRKIRDLEAANRDLSERIATLRIKLIAANVKIALLQKKVRCSDD